MISDKKPPIFVLGCPRSGTTLLYHMLLSSGEFAIYRAESQVFSVIAPRFNNLRTVHAREQLADAWIGSFLFNRSGLDAEGLREKIVDDCHNPGDFLRLVMESIAEKQGVTRWADCTPTHLLHIPDIKKTIPEARVIHIIRDGRDVALSLAKANWARPLPWRKEHLLDTAALYWDWIVERGRAYGEKIGSDYVEVSFEQLVSDPRGTLDRLSSFVDVNLDYQLIREAGIGSVSRPNSSFSGDQGTEFHPVGRWREKLSRAQVTRVEQLIGRRLQRTGYDLSTGDASGKRSNWSAWAIRNTHGFWFSVKQWLKSRKPVGRRMVSIKVAEPNGRTRSLLRNS